MPYSLDRIKLQAAKTLRKVAEALHDSGVSEADIPDVVFKMMSTLPGVIPIAERARRVLGDDRLLAALKEAAAITYKLLGPPPSHEVLAQRDPNGMMLAALTIVVADVNKSVTDLRNRIKALTEIMEGVEHAKDVDATLKLKLATAIAHFSAAERAMHSVVCEKCHADIHGEHASEPEPAVNVAASKVLH